MYQNAHDPMNRGKYYFAELFVNDKREGLSRYFYPRVRLKEEVLNLEQ